MGIQNKKKPCSGTTAETKGLGCGVPTYHRQFGLGKMCGCLNDWMMSTESGKIYYEKMNITPKSNPLIRKKSPINKKSSNPIPRLLQMTVDVCHQFIKLRDHGRPCVSCGCPWDESFQACHYYKAELYSTLKFNEMNIHGGCVECNIHLDGNLEQYGERIQSRIGWVELCRLIAQAEMDSRTNHKWDRVELGKIYQYYCDKIKIIKTQKNVCGIK